MILFYHAASERRKKVLIPVFINLVPSHLFYPQHKLVVAHKRCHLMFLRLKARHLVEVLGGKLHRNNVP